MLARTALTCELCSGCVTPVVPSLSVNRTEASNGARNCVVSLAKILKVVVMYPNKAGSMGEKYIKKIALPIKTRVI